MKNFLRRILIFLRKEERKVFSFLFITIRILFSFFLITIVPIIFFLFFIFLNPKEIVKLNNYILNKIATIKNIKEINITGAKISLDDKLNINYEISDLNLKIENFYFKFPKVILKIKLKDIIKKNFIINYLNVDNFTGYFGYNENDNIDKNTLNLTKEELKLGLYKILDYLYNDNLFFKRIIVKNSFLYFFNSKNNNLDKIEVLKIDLNIFDNRQDFSLLFNLDTRLNNSDKIVSSENKCDINKNKDVICSIKFNNLSIDKVLSIVDAYDLANKYNSLISGNFDLFIDLKFKNYIDIDNTSFILKSKSGNFNLNKYFGGSIDYKDFILNGFIKNENIIVLDNLTAKLKHDNSDFIDFSSYIYFEKNKKLVLNFNIKNADFKYINIFWPVFLDNLGIRDWVVEHIPNGKITSAFAYMNFDYDNNFNLSSISSDVNFNDTNINYYSNFPSICDAKGKVSFTKNDMKFDIEKANIVNTKLYNTTIYTNFNDKIPSLDIKTSGYGKLYELFYFINNNRKNVKNIVNTIADGYATSKLNIIIPFVNDLNFDDVAIKYHGKITKNNTFLLSDNSEFYVDFIKEKLSSIIKVDLNLNNSLIKIPFINLIKNKNQKLNLNLDIDVLDDNIFLKNILSDSDFIKFFGNGIISSGNLKYLEINNFNFDKTIINFAYREKENDVVYVSLNSDNLKLDYKYNNFLNNGNFKIKKNVNFEGYFKNTTISNNYNFKFLKTNIFYRNGNFDFVDINLNSENNTLKLESYFDNDNYILELSCKNFGDFLSESGIFDKIIFGNLYFNGNFNKISNFNGKIKLTNFSFIIKNLKNDKYFNYILNSSLINKKTKRRLKTKNTISFKKMKSDVIFYGDILSLKNVLFESDDVFGMGLSGTGKFNIKTGNFDFNGLVIPVDKLNTLFGMNKVPIVNNILFGGKNGGLFTFGYEIKKNNYNENINFRLIPASVMNTNSIKNLLLIFLLI